MEEGGGAYQQVAAEGAAAEAEGGLGFAGGAAGLYCTAGQPGGLAAAGGVGDVGDLQRHRHPRKDLLHADAELGALLHRRLLLHEGPPETEVPVD